MPHPQANQLLSASSGIPPEPVSVPDKRLGLEPAAAVPMAPPVPTIESSAGQQAAQTHTVAVSQRAEPVATPASAPIIASASIIASQ